MEKRNHFLKYRTALHELEKIEETRDVFLYFPTPLKSLPRPAEVLQSPTTPGEGLRKLAEGCGDSWGKACGKPVKGCGDYSWRTSAEACEGLRRLLRKAWGKLAKGRELTAKWLQSGANWPRSLARRLQSGANWPRNLEI